MVKLACVLALENYVPADPKTSLETPIWPDAEHDRIRPIIISSFFITCCYVKCRKNLADSIGKFSASYSSLLPDQIESKEKINYHYYYSYL